MGGKSVNRGLSACELGDLTLPQNVCGGLGINYETQTHTHVVILLTDCNSGTIQKLCVWGMSKRKCAY
jgi:hypothetical protein